MRGSRGWVAALWALFASVAIVSGWIAVQMVGYAVTPASLPVLTAGEVSQRLTTAEPTDASPRATPRTSKEEGKKKEPPTSSTSPQPTGSPATTTSPRPSPAKSTTSAPRPTAVVRTLASKGGSVVAACLSGQVTLRSWSPAVGYRVDEVEVGPDQEVEIRFVSKTAEVKMQVQCVSGVPVAESEYDPESGDDD